MGKQRGTNRKCLMVLAIIFILLMGLTGCSSTKEAVSSYGDGQNQGQQKEEIIPYGGEKSKAVSYVYTTEKKLSLTFNGMGDEKMMDDLLTELDRHGIQATFFLPGMRVAEEPDIARKIIDQGHEIANNTLNRWDLTKLGYEEIYREIARSNAIIEAATGIPPKYIRPQGGAYNDDVLLVTAQCGLEALVNYSINPQDWDMKEAREIGDYVERYITRGGIIALNSDKNPEVIKAIPLIARAVEQVGYELVPLSQLFEGAYERRPLEAIEGYDAAKLNHDFENTPYQVIHKVKTREKEIALTFDDWGRDITVTQILDILERYNIKSTFFLKADGAEVNPNLAKAIHEAGHEIANHTYSHSVITELSAEKIQEEVVKAHRVLAEVIQAQPVMLFRPPTGAYDHRSAQIVAATGYDTIAMYDVTTFDWDINNTAEDIAGTILKKTQPGSIILLHILDDTNTVEALPMAIEALLERGYTFKILTDLLN